jgi:gluconate 5-dehydrogenase
VAFELFNLVSRRALVTGSSQGIGLAIARGLAEHGASVVLNGRDGTKLDAAAASLRSAGHDIAVAGFDATNVEAVRDGVSRVEQTIGPIDILVNNAGMQFRTPLEDFPAEKWEELLRTNISSAFYVGQAVARHMIPRGRGKIINIASVQSELARPGIAPYTATKGAIKNLTRGMCADWAKYGIQVNAIAPGYFKTRTSSVQRCLSSDVAQPVTPEVAGPFFRAPIWLRNWRQKGRPQAAFLSLRMTMKSSTGGGGNALGW